VVVGQGPPAGGAQRNVKRDRECYDMMLAEMEQRAFKANGAQWIECRYSKCPGHWQARDRLFKNLKGIKMHLAASPACKASLMRKAVAKFT
jgi:hypothetical protein